MSFFLQRGINIALKLYAWMCSDVFPWCYSNRLYNTDTWLIQRNHVEKWETFHDVVPAHLYEVYMYKQTTRKTEFGGGRVDGGKVTPLVVSFETLSGS